jgi:hypothetical protein
MNIEILNWPRPLWEADQGVVKRTGRDEPVEIVTHICMETTQRYLYLKLAKMHVSLIIFFVFSSIKLENKKAEQVLPGVVGRTGVRWEVVGKGVGG